MRFKEYKFARDICISMLIMKVRVPISEGLFRSNPYRRFSATSPLNPNMVRPLIPSNLDSRTLSGDAPDSGLILYLRLRAT